MSPKYIWAKRDKQTHRAGTRHCPYRFGFELFLIAGRHKALPLQER